MGGLARFPYKNMGEFISHRRRNMQSMCYLGSGRQAVFSLGSSEGGKTLYLEIVKADFCCSIRATFKGKHQ